MKLFYFYLFTILCGLSFESSQKNATTPFWSEKNHSANNTIYGRPSNSPFQGLLNRIMANNSLMMSYNQTFNDTINETVYDYPSNGPFQALFNRTFNSTTNETVYGRQSNGPFQGLFNRTFNSTTNETAYGRPSNGPFQGLFNRTFNSTTNETVYGRPSNGPFKGLFNQTFNSTVNETVYDHTFNETHGMCVFNIFKLNENTTRYYFKHLCTEMYELLPSDLLNDIITSIEQNMNIYYYYTENIMSYSVGWQGKSNDSFASYGATLYISGEIVEGAIYYDID
jgi:hypothetical protein